MSDFIIENGVLTKYTGNSEYVIVPEDVKSIGECAFYRSCIKKITLPCKLKSIKSQAFANCSKLTEIEIPDSVTTIGKYAFSNSALEHIKLSEKLKKISEHAFCSTNLQSIDIPEGVTKIEDGAFEFCTKLESVRLPRSLESIGYGAFRDNYELREIHVVSGTTVCGTAFDFCVGLADNNGFIVVNGGLFKSPAMYKTSKVVLPNSVRVIKYGSIDMRRDVDGVMWCKNRDEYDAAIRDKVGSIIEIPESVKKIEEGAFSGDVQEIISHSMVPFDTRIFNQDCKIKKITVPKETEVAETVFNTDENSVKKFSKIKIEYI